MVYEWDYHNVWYEMGISQDRSGDVDLDNADEGKSWWQKAWEGVTNR